MCCLCCSLEYLYSWSFILEFEPPSVVEANAEPPSLVFWLSRDALPSCFLFNEVVSRLSGSWCPSSRLFALRPGSFWICMYLIRVIFLSIRVLSEMFFQVVFDSSGFFLILSWFLPHLFQVVCTSSRSFLNLYVPHLGCFLINPGSFWICLGTCSTSSGLFYDRSGFFLDLSWYLPYLVGVLFWSIRVLSELVLVLAVPHRRSFLIKPGCFWTCLSKIALKSLFFPISWYRCSSHAC